MSTAEILGGERLARLRALAHLNRLISSSLDVEEVLRAVAQAAAELMDAPAASFWIADETARRLTLRAWERTPQKARFPTVSVAYGTSGVGWVAQHRTLLNVADVRHDDRVAFTEWLRAQDLTSFLGVPVLFGTTLLAVLGINGRHPFDLGPEEQALLDVFMAQAAAALHHAHRHAEEARTRELLRSIRDLSTDAIVTTDIDGRITSCNPRAEALFGHRAAEVAGRPLWDYWGVGEGERAAIERRLTAREEIRHHEASVRRSDGRMVRTVASLTRLRETEGALAGYVGVIRDLTDQTLADAERARLEAQLRRTHDTESLAWLAGGIAHDIRGAGAAIMDRVARLRDALGAAHPAGEHVDALEAAASRVAALAGPIAAFPTPEPARPTRVDLNATVEELVPVLKRLVGDGVDLRTRLDPGLGDLHADREQIRQVILHLVVAARAVLPAGDRVTIESVDADESAPLTVRAEGARVVGMAESPAAVVGLVEQAGGTLEITHAPERSVTLRLRLPRAEASPDMPTPVEPPVEGVRETILLVDDDHLVRDFTREMLTRDGYTVLVARDGAEALRIAAARSEPIHLLLTDVVMPRLSGINTAARLAETHPGIRILYVSGYTDDAIFRNGVAQGEVSFLAKPFTRHELAAKVREVLDRPAGA